MQTLVARLERFLARNAVLEDGADEDAEEAGPAGSSSFEGTMPARGHHMAFELDDCAHAVEQLQSSGIPIAAGPQSRPDGFRQVYIHDPDGYLVELFSAPASNQLK